MAPLATRRVLDKLGVSWRVSWSISRLLCSRTSPFLYHPQTRVLEPITQALYLTKAVRMQDNNQSCVQSHELDDALRTEFLSSFRKNIIQTRLFNYEGERSTKETCALPLMQNMLKEVWSRVDRFPGLENTSLSYKPHVSVSWTRGGHALQVAGNLDFLLLSKNPVIPFASLEKVEETMHSAVEKPDVISPVFNLHRLNTKHVTDTGFHPGAPFPHPHTLVIVSTKKNWSIEDTCAQGAMFTFAQLAAEALKCRGHTLGSVLKRPLAAQCIITNGVKLSFLRFQLNTLDFKDDQGIKNMVWLEPGLPMYQKASLHEIPGPRRSDPKIFDPVVEGFNEQAFELFLNFLSQDVLEQ